MKRDSDNTYISSCFGYGRLLGNMNQSISMSAVTERYLQYQ